MWQKHRQLIRTLTFGNEVKQETKITVEFLNTQLNSLSDSISKKYPSDLCSDVVMLSGLLANVL